MLYHGHSLNIDQCGYDMWQNSSKNLRIVCSTKEHPMTFGKCVMNTGSWPISWMASIPLHISTTLSFTISSHNYCSYWVLLRMDLWKTGRVTFVSLQCILAWGASWFLFFFLPYVKSNINSHFACILSTSEMERRQFLKIKD